MLDRLRITQRLSLLLLLPLAAVVLISVPFAVQRVDAARSAAAIVDSADNARTIGSVIQEIEQERLLALGYLASDRLQRSSLVVQMNSSVDAAAQARASVVGAGAGRLRESLDRVPSLDALRQQVLARATSASDVYRAYHDVVVALLDSLRLADQPGADAVGLRQMSSFDALLRLNEEANQIGAALVVAATDPDAAKAFIIASRPLEQIFVGRFQQEETPATLTSSHWSRRYPRLNARIRSPRPSPPPARRRSRISIDDGLSTAQTGVDIRRGLQNRIADDIATDATRRAAEARNAATLVAGLAFTLLISVIWLGVSVSRSVARPLRRITLAATAVADLASRELIRVNDVESDDIGPPRLAALTLRSADEIGELASAFNRVQATAALLMEQQVTTRRNVSVMFANIAHRTQSLVARQLAHIDALERNEPDEQRLAKLYPLDHLTTRLRRSADSLLVIAGTRDEGRIASPTSLADVVRSAAAEVEGYQNIELGAISNVTVTAAGVPDLTLLVAELLENATAFSPPNVPVEVSATYHAGCLVRIVDRGIGMSPDRLAEENARLISRERLDVAPTTMLGLFVVSRLARRHSISVRLLPTPVTGITAEIAIPAEMLMMASGPQRPESLPAPRASSPVPGEARRSFGSPMLPDRDFGWFQGPLAPNGVAVPAINGSAPGPIEAGRGGLRRRQRGATLADTESTSVPAQVGFPMRDPETERADLDGFARAAARAAEATPPTYGPQPSLLDSRLSQAASLMGQPPVPRPAAPQPDRGAGPLHRRRPGEHLPEALRAETSERRARPGQHRVPETARPPRDAAAERAALNGYLDGLARAVDDSPHRPDHWS